MPPGWIAARGYAADALARFRVLTRGPACSLAPGASNRDPNEGHRFYPRSLDRLRERRRRSLRSLWPSLLIPEKADPERDAVASAWEEAGGVALRFGRFWDPPPLDKERVRVYGNDTFCLVLE